LVCLGRCLCGGGRRATDITDVRLTAHDILGV
jgi:hypothetical protein